MKLLFYILREHFLPFFLSLLIILFFFSIDFLIRLLDLVLSKNISFWIIAEIFVLNLAWMISLAIPMSCLITSLLAYGRLSSDNEILALGSHGINPYRMLFPIALVSSILCILLILFNNYVLPKANHRSVEMKQAIIRTNSPAFIQPRTVIKDFKNYRIWIDSIDYKTNSLYHIQIYHFDKNAQRPNITIAKFGLMSYSEDGKYLSLKLKDGENHRFQVDQKTKKNRYFKIAFKDQVTQIENINTDFKKTERNYYSDRELSIGQMLDRANKSQIDADYYAKLINNLPMLSSQKIDSLITLSKIQITKSKIMQDSLILFRSYYQIILGNIHNLKTELNAYVKKRIRYQKTVNRYWVEIHKKITLPFACILFSLVGATLGMVMKRGRITLETTICVFLFIIYWVCLLKGENLADNLVIPPWLAMWTPNFIILVVGIWTFIKGRSLIKTR